MMESVSTFEVKVQSNRIKNLRKRANRPQTATFTVRCLFPRQQSREQQHNQSHKKRFTLNITHYHEMLISVAHTDGPQKHISAD